MALQSSSAGTDHTGPGGAAAWSNAEWDQRVGSAMQPRGECSFGGGASLTGRRTHLAPALPSLSAVRGRARSGGAPLGGTGRAVRDQSPFRRGPGQRHLTATVISLILPAFLGPCTVIPSPAGGSGAWAGPNARGAAARARRPPYAVLGQAGGRQAKHRHPAGQAKHAPGRAGQHRQAGAAAEGVHTHARSRSVPRGVFLPLGPPISVSLAHCTPARHAGGKQARHHRAEAKPASRRAGRRAAGTQGVQSERWHPVHRVL